MSVELKPLIAKLNPTCRKAFESAAELCVAQTNFSVEIEHLLLKLAEQADNDVQAILRHYDVSIPKLKAELTRSIESFKRGNQRTPSLSPYILALLREAWLTSTLRLENGFVRSGAMLLAIIDHEAIRGGLVETLPSLLRISRESLRQDIVELIKFSSEAATTPILDTSATSSSATTTTQVASSTPALNQYTVDLTEEARSGRIDPIEGRDGEIRKIIDILMRRRQNNPILTGDPGVGKTAVVEGFALRIAKGDVPPSLQNVLVRTLDLGLLQAGAGMKGEFENRLKSVINEVKASPQPIILFIDEAHTLIGAGGQTGQGDAANLLKPALARGELRTIAATTWAEYKKYFEKDAALTRRFQVVKVDEPSEDVAVIMLRSVVANLEKHHKIKILDEAVRDAVCLSHRYISGRQLPDKAVSVLDTACARVAVGQNSSPAVIEATLHRINRMQEEQRLLQREQATGVNHAQRLAEVNKQLEDLDQLRQRLEQRWKNELDSVKAVQTLEQQLEPYALKLPTEGTDLETLQRLQKELEAAKQQLASVQGHDPMIPIHVNGHIVATVISGWTGIPAGKMLTDEINTVLNIKEKMAERIVGQPYALETIARRVKTYRANLDDPNKPTGVFLLVGPSGVGKTETAITLAELLYGGEDNMVTINMSEYQEAHTVSSLKGAPPGYVGYGKGGVLTEAVRRNPYSVVLLDEVEKAHPDVMEVFYQVFDKGTLEDGEGLVVDFKNTVILLTSNIGTETIMRACNTGTATPEYLQEAVRPELLQQFKAAFLGRLVIVPYLPLGDAEIRRIAGLKLAKIQKRFMENQRAKLTYDESLINTIVSRCTEVDTGARNIDHILSDTVLPALSVEILEHMAKGQSFASVHLTCDEQGTLHYSFDGTESVVESIDQSTHDSRAELLGDLDALLDWLKSS